MSELFAVRVVAVKGETAQLSLRRTHPDAGAVQATATFALQLLYDPVALARFATSLQRYTHLGASPITTVMDVKDSLDPAWLRRHAGELVAGVRTVRGGLEIRATHPAWVAHLRKGMAWGTASYSCGEALPARPRAPQPSGGSTTGRDPARGFTVKKPKFRGLTIAKVHVPKFVAARYVAHPSHEGEQAIRRAARSLLGEPVVVVPRRGPAEVGTLCTLGEVSLSIYRDIGTSSYRWDELERLGRAYLADQP